MGGMIAQTIAIEHPERVLSLTSIMSTTGDPSVGQPDARGDGRALDAAAATDREGAIERSVSASQVIGSPEHFDEERAGACRGGVRPLLLPGRHRPPAHRHPGVGLARGRAARARRPDARHPRRPTTRWSSVSGGERTAELIPGAELLLVEGMGHDLPQVFWAQVVEAVTRLATKEHVA